MGSANLPTGWREARFGDIVKSYLSGGTPSTSESSYWNGNIPWTTSAPISETDVVLRTAQRFITDSALASSSTNLVPSGSLLLGTRVGVGKAVVNDIDIAISQDLTGAVLDTDLVHAMFAAYVFKSSATQAYLAGRKRGTTIKGVSRFDLDILPIALPPLPEQRAVAHILRAVQAAKETRERELALERERKAALMEHLFTHGTRGEATKLTEIGEVPQSWEVLKLGEYLKQAQYGLSAKGEQKGKYPLLRMTNQQDGRIVPSDLQYVDIDAAEAMKFQLNRGDLLFNRTNSLDLVGRTALFDIEGDYVFASYLIRLAVDPSWLLPAYLNFYLNKESTQARLKGIATRGVSQSNISASRLKTFQIPVSSIEVQSEITDALSACDAKIAALERENMAVGELFRAILEELMTGRKSVKGLA